MKKFQSFCIALSIFTLLAPAAAEEAPDDDIIREVLAEEGFSDMRETFEDLRNSPEDVAHFLKAKWFIEEERLQRSDARVIRISEQYGAAGMFPATQRVMEVLEVPLSTGNVMFMKTLEPQEVQRREMEESGIPPEQMAEAMEAYGYGAMALGEQLRKEMAGNEFGQLMIGKVGGFPMQERGVPKGDSQTNAALGNEEPCVGYLERVSEQESAAVLAEVKPWTSMNPATFMMGPACMAFIASDIFGEMDNLNPDERQQIAESMNNMLTGITPMGPDTVQGRPTQKLRVNNVNMTVPIDAALGNSSGGDVTPARYAASDGEQVPALFRYEDADTGDLSALFHRAQSRAGNSTMTINSIEMWIDSEYFVDRKMRMEGVMTEGRESRDVFFERELQDYRNVPNSALYLPYRSVMRAGGVLTEQQRKELAEAQKQLEEFDRQLAEMPAAQRQMMENMMGGQMEQMRSLVTNGAVEIVMQTTDVEINPSFRNPMLVQFANEELGDPGESEGNIVKRIQVDLTTLGYEPGNRNGELDVMTKVAISQFEADNKMPVTGEASIPVAMALAEAVAER